MDNRTLPEPRLNLSLETLRATYRIAYRFMRRFVSLKALREGHSRHAGAERNPPLHRWFNVAALIPSDWGPPNYAETRVVCRRSLHVKHLVLSRSTGTDSSRKSWRRNGKR